MFQHVVRVFPDGAEVIVTVERTPWTTARLRS